MKRCRRERIIETGLGRVRVRPIAGFTGYWIGEDGSVWTSRPLRPTWPAPSTLRRVRASIRNTPGRGFGYVHVCLRRPGSRTVYTLYVHSLVLAAFVGPRPTPRHEACHAPNNDRTDNRLLNLRWDTPEGNAADKKRRGLDLDPMAELRAELATIAAGLNPEPIPF